MSSKEPRLTDADRLYLSTAIALADRGRYSTPPNPRVGCVFVRNGRVLGRGWHVRTGEGHAEVNALSDAGDVRGATAYVSLEPCAFHGRTPACADTLIGAGVARVVGALTDPHPQVAGLGYDRLREAGVAVDTDELPEARALNPGYLHRQTHGRPWIRLKVAASLDGATAMASGESQWITGAAARADVQELRARSCAVLTGIGTVLADDPRLNVRDAAYALDGVLRQPLRIVLDSRLRTPQDANVLADGGALVVHAESAPATQLPGERHACGETAVDLTRLVDYLGTRELNEVLVEAGARLTGAFLKAGLWDELVVYLAPKLMGEATRRLADLGIERLGDAVAARFADVRMVGEDIKLTVLRQTSS